MNWTGIGTRGFLTDKVINRQFAFGVEMARNGHSLWTGGAVQSDYNFLDGACSGLLIAPDVKCHQNVVRSVGMERYKKPWDLKHTLHLCEESDLQIAVDYFVENGILPKDFFKKVDPITRALHARNFYQVMESPEKIRSELVVFAAKEDRWGNVEGGTRTAVNLARHNKIPTFNIKRDSEWDLLVKHVTVNKILPQDSLGDL